MKTPPESAPTVIITRASSSVSWGDAITTSGSTRKRFWFRKTRAAWLRAMERTRPNPIMGVPATPSVIWGDATSPPIRLPCTSPASGISGAPDASTKAVSGLPGGLTASKMRRSPERSACTPVTCGS